MAKTDIRAQWEGAAPGWARWEPTVAAWMHPATEAMLDMAGVGAGARVLDLACGAGSQTLLAARRVGRQGHVAAIDIADTITSGSAGRRKRETRVIGAGAKREDKKLQ